MNEKGPWIIISIILFFLLIGAGVFFGKNLHDNGNTIKQLEKLNTELGKEVRGFKRGFEIISEESRKRGEINTELRKTVNDLEKDQGRYQENLDSVYTQLTETTTELNRFREEARKRSEQAISASEDLREEIERIDEIITEIENGAAY